MKKIVYILYALVAIALACKHATSSKEEQINAVKVLKPPVKIALVNPIVKPAGVPFKIDIPKTKHIGTFANGQKLEMEPPSTINLVGTEALGESAIQRYNVEDGLALSSVFSGCMDKEGRIWLGTQGAGASCFDGKSFTTYNTDQGLVTNVVAAIAQDKKGNMWFATDLGVSCYDGKVFKSYTADNGLPYNLVWHIYEDRKGNIWFATDGGGATCYNGKGFTTYTTKHGLVDNKVIYTTEDNAGNLWFTTGNGISCYNGKTFTNYPSKQGLPKKAIVFVAQDKQGKMWFGTQGDGLSCYDGKRFTTYTTKEGISGNRMKCVTKDKKGNLWFGSDNGITFYDGENFTAYTTTWGLERAAVNIIIEDKSGNLWVGTDGEGLSRYDGSAFTYYTTKQGLPNDAAWSFTEDKKGNIWMATDFGGVSCLSGNSITNYSTAQGIADRVINMNSDKNGNLWFGSDGSGISCYDGKSFTHYGKAQGLVSNSTRDALIDRKGRLWVCTINAGVSCYNGKTFTNYTTKQGLISNSVWKALEDKKGNIWFATDDGISCFDGKYFTNYTTEQGLSDNIAFSIVEDKCGNLWVGTANAVNRYDGKSFKAYTMADGMSNSMAFAIVVDKQDNLVFGTNLGFSRIIGYEQKVAATEKKIIPASNNFSNAELQQLNAKPIFEQYHFKNGYPVKDVNSNAMYCDSKGIIWAGTGDKVIRFNPLAVNKNNSPLYVTLQNIKVDNENICWQDLVNPEKIAEAKQEGVIPANSVEEIRVLGRSLTESERDSMRKKFSDLTFDSITPFYSLPQHLVVPYKHNSLTFDFVAVEPARPYLVNYQYILENYDKEWSPLSNKTNVTYSHLPEGFYTFKLKAQSPDGVWSKPITYTFKILPPWYRTWWAYIMYVFAISVLLYSVYRWRTAALRKENEVLEEKVTERTLQLDQSNKELQHQKVELEISQKKVIDSINYAKKIQYSTLPSEEEIKPYFPDYFVHFMPKDTISGDFYWFYHNEGLSYIAVADCTGHGVPGALMSMMSYSLLNEVMLDERLSDPSKILSSLHRLVFKTLQQHKGDEYSQDGLDISLCIIDHTNRLLHFSGARNNVFIVNSKEVTVLKATSRSIGGISLTGEIEPERQFKSETIELKERVLLIMSTDGIFDQLNTTDEKFGTKRFKELIQSLYGKSMEESRTTVSSAIHNWKQTAHQQDDLLVAGFVI